MCYLKRLLQHICIKETYSAALKYSVLLILELQSFHRSLVLVSWFAGFESSSDDINVIHSYCISSCS
jgi:hypothetical protein